MAVCSEATDDRWIEDVAPYAIGIGSGLLFIMLFIIIYCAWPQKKMKEDTHNEQQHLQVSPTAMSETSSVAALINQLQQQSRDIEAMRLREQAEFERRLVLSPTTSIVVHDDHHSMGVGDERAIGDIPIMGSTPMRQLEDIQLQIPMHSSPYSQGDDYSPRNPSSLRYVDPRVGPRQIGYPFANMETSASRESTPLRGQHTPQRPQHIPQRPANYQPSPVPAVRGDTRNNSNSPSPRA
jgi:hypothetical protein